MIHSIQFIRFLIIYIKINTTFLCLFHRNATRTFQLLLGFLEGVLGHFFATRKPPILFPRLRQFSFQSFQMLRSNGFRLLRSLPEKLLRHANEPVLNTLSLASWFGINYSTTIFKTISVSTLIEQFFRILFCFVLFYFVLFLWFILGWILDIWWSVPKGL